VPVTEVAGLRRSYRALTGVLRRSSRDVKAVRMGLLRFLEAESRRHTTLHIA
jgi:hypothetical protein